jgi:hypothetical protein
VADDRVAAAAAELYGADPEAFTERRQALAAEAKTAGDKSAAAAIAALRKPTRAAWVVNRLARADPDAPARLAALAAELRAAEQAKDGPRLRELSADRGALLDGLTARALAAADVPEPPSALREEVAATLTAALADPETAAAFAAGTLTKAAQWSGFGYADLGPAEDASAPRLTAVPRATAAPRASAAPRLTVVPGPARRPGQTDRAKRNRADASSSAQEAAQRAAQEKQRLAAEEQRLAQEAAERAARAREKYEDAERTLAQASTAAADAGAMEDRLEAEVRDLEERLTKAREDLADARRRARHAEAAERRARQTLDRLPHPLRPEGLCRHTFDCLV